MPPRNIEVLYRTRGEDEVVTTLDVVDARQVVAGAPVRDFPVYVGRSNYSGYFWSATMGRHVVYESLLEQSWLWLADFDREITGVAAQPMRLQGLDGNRTRTRIPDFMCLTSTGVVCVVDVKPAAMLEKVAVADSLAWTAKTCRSRGWEYEVWTGPNPVVLRNVRWIAAARSPHVMARLDTTRTADAASTGCTLADLEARLTSVDQRSPHLEVLGALWSGALTTDLTIPLGSASWLEPSLG